MNKIYEDIEFSNFEYEEVNEADGSSGDLGNSPNGIIGVVKGPSFFLNGFSRNGRFYPKELWEKALKNKQLKSRLERGLVFGCIGHPEDYTLDGLIESGKVSHRVSDIKIDEKTGAGIATFEILDTPSGRILNTLLRSGSKFYVSTRAFGSFTNETKEKDGKKYKILDSDNFYLESIDFVVEPGFLETNPKLIESIQGDLQKLREDKHNIKCEDGLCNLFEEVKPVKEDQESQENFEQLASLDKSELITIIENLTKENKHIRKVLEDDFYKTVQANNTVDSEDGKEDDTDNSNNDKENINPKLKRNLLSYVELLLKLLKYNSEYEKYYEKLISFLDKDDQISKSDLSSLETLVQEILEDETIEKSIKAISEKIKTFIEVINKKREENLNIKEDLSISSDMFDMIEKFKDAMKLQEKQLGEKFKKALESKDKIIEQLKSATLNLASQKPEVKEKVIVKEVEVHVDTEETLQKIENLEEKIQKEQNENKELKNSLENLEGLIKKLSEEKNRLIEEIEKAKEALKESHTTIIETNKKYFQALYKVDQHDVEEAFSKFGQDLEKVQNFLEKKEKMYRRTSSTNEWYNGEFTVESNNQPKKSLLAEKLI